MKLVSHRFVLLAVAVLIGAPPLVRAANTAGPFSDNFKLGERAKNYAEDNVRYHDAQQKLDDANTDLVQARHAAVADYQSSNEFVAAAKAVGDSYRAYQSKKRQVIRQIEQKDPRYNELRKQATAVDAELVRARSIPTTSIPQFESLYNKKSVFTREMRALENDALVKSGSIELQKRWQTASQHLADMRTRQDAVIEKSSGVKLAMVEVTKAKNKMDDIGAKLAGTKAAYAEAQSQQTAANNYLHRYPTYTGAYDGFGYGWGLTPVYGGTVFYGTYGYPVNNTRGDHDHDRDDFHNPTWPWYH